MENPDHNNNEFREQRIVDETLGMGMEAKSREAGDKLEIFCSGPCTQADLLGLVDAIAAARKANPNLRKCLIDAQNAEFRLGGIGEFFVGEYAAKRLAGMKISLLAPPGQVTKLLENAAFNRGLKFLLADSQSTAEAWLADA